ncbi:MAG TPA: hypothetical protein VMP38_06925 [Candidatus Acidoferrum sp.]|nr:hypothetical protein [Candidatus Acidoferrum sp.]
MRHIALQGEKKPGVEQEDLDAERLRAAEESHPLRRWKRRWATHIVSPTGTSVSTKHRPSSRVSAHALGVRTVLRGPSE